MTRIEENEQIFLVGFMGAGKTTVGKALSVKLHRPFVDLDTEITNYLDSPVTDIFREKGEPFFRDTETEVLKNVLSENGPSVIATGGGIVLRDSNWELMNSSGKVIYLKADIDKIWHRIKKDTSRPLLNVNDAFNEAKKIFGHRKKLYEKADFTVSTDHLNVEQTVKKIQNLLFL